MLPGPGFPPLCCAAPDVEALCEAVLPLLGRRGRPLSLMPRWPLAGRPPRIGKGLPRRVDHGVLGVQPFRVLRFRVQGL